MAKKSFAEILAEQEEAQSRKVASKMPGWVAVKGLRFPTSLCLEQCSSEAAALYKADVAAGLGVMTAADLTGGLGVDSWAFSRRVRTVYYNEMNPGLHDAARDNFVLLGSDNIICSCEDASARLGSIPDVDMIYMDPARRSSTGNKVFLLEDCTPNVLEMRPALQTKSALLMLKLSPMADIAMLSARLGRTLKEVHVVGNAGEVKELLCILDRSHDGDFEIIATDLRNMMRAGMEAIRNARPAYSDPVPGNILFEPDPVLMKAGMAVLLGMPRMAPSTHLYISGEPHGFGRNWKIEEVHPFGKAAIKALGARFPQCEITSRNLPLTSDELRKKMGSASGGQAHIFGAAGTTQRFLLVCSPIRP